ncbi:MAG: hypothetical protein ACLQO1_12630 [Steroidobacteraceae bacterium]
MDKARDVAVIVGSLRKGSINRQVGGADKLFDANGKLVNDGTRKFLQSFLQAFATWVATNIKT